MSLFIIVTLAVGIWLAILAIGIVCLRKYVDHSYTAAKIISANDVMYFLCLYICLSLCLFRLRNDLYCVEWDVKLYYTIPYLSAYSQDNKKLAVKQVSSRRRQWCLLSSSMNNDYWRIIAL